MIYIIISITLIFAFLIIWIRSSRDGSHNHSSKMWQHHQDQNYIDDYARKSKKTPPPPYNDEFWDPYD